MIGHGGGKGGIVEQHPHWPGHPSTTPEGIVGRVQGMWVVYRGGGLLVLVMNGTTALVVGGDVRDATAAVGDGEEGHVGGERGEEGAWWWREEVMCDGEMGGRNGEEGVEVAKWRCDEKMADCDDVLQQQRVMTEMVGSVERRGPATFGPCCHLWASCPPDPAKHESLDDADCKKKKSRKQKLVHFQYK